MSLMALNCNTLLECAGLTASALAMFAVIASVCFIVVSIWAIIWFRRTVREVALKTSQKASQEAIAKVMSQFDIQSMVIDAVRAESDAVKADIGIIGIPSIPDKEEPHD